MSIKLQIGDRLWPDGMSISQPMQVAAFPSKRTAALVDEDGDASIFVQQSDGTWLCDMGADSGGRYWARIDHRTVFEPKIEDAEDASLTEAARASFEGVCRQAGMEPTEERWERLKREFVKDERDRRTEAQARERAGHFAQKRHDFLKALNTLVEQAGCYIEFDLDGDGIFIVSPGAEDVTHIERDDRTGFYVAVGRTHTESAVFLNDNELLGVEDDEV